MKKSKKIFSTALICAFVVYLIFANSIVALFIPSNQKLEKYDFEVHSADGFYGALTIENYFTNALESVCFAGWSYIDAKPYADSKEVRVLFRQDKISYRSQAATFVEDKDIVKLFNDNSSKKDQAFSVNVSTLNMKNGDYETFLEITQNSGTSCIMPTGRSFRKEGITFNEITVLANVSEPQKADEDKNIDFFVSPITENDKGIFIDGWAYLPKADSTKQNMFAELTSADGSIKWYKLIPNDYPENANVNEPVDAIRCRFKTTIAREELKAGDMLIRIVIGNEKSGYKKSQIAAGYTYALQQ